MLRKSLSGESQATTPIREEKDQDIDDHTGGDTSMVEVDDKTARGKHSKRNRSGDQHNLDASGTVIASQNKKKKLARSKTVGHLSEGIDSSPSTNVKLTELPPETPEWGLKLLEIIQNEFRSVNTSITMVEDSTKLNSTNILAIEKQLSDIEGVK